MPLPFQLELLRCTALTTRSSKKVKMHTESKKSFVSNVLKKKKNYNNLDVKQITDNKNFWTSVKPLFADKGLKSKNIIMIENEKIISDVKEIAKTMNNFFTNTVKNLNIEEVENNLTRFDNIFYLVFCSNWLPISPSVSIFRSSLQYTIVFTTFEAVKKCASLPSLSSFTYETSFDCQG